MRYILVYDPGCGPCTRFRDAVSFLDARGRIACISLGEADSVGILAGVPLGRRHRSFHLVSSEPMAWSGADAFPKLVSLFPAGMLPSAMLKTPPLAFLSKFVYSVLSRLHDSGSCSHRPGPAPAVECSASIE